MPDQLPTSACDALRRVLGGAYVVTVDDHVTAVFTSLPDRCPAAATRVDGHLWVMVDLDKPLALRHARAMISDYRSSVTAVDLGDDDLNRDWQLQSGLLPLPRPAEDPPLRMRAPWVALAACAISGATATGVVEQMLSVAQQVATAGLA